MDAGQHDLPVPADTRRFASSMTRCAMRCGRGPDMGMIQYAQYRRTCPVS